MSSLAARHERFAALHAAGTFVIPNPWDAGSARMVAALGAVALATTSSGFAFTLGRPDMGRVSRDEALAHAEAIVAATPLPVSGDLENGFADDPDGVAETVRLAAEAGLSGCSIEDTVMTEGNPAYEPALAAERIRAAVSAARGLGRPFVLCARADGVLTGSYGIDEAIRRVQAFEAAGADLLYVPLPGGEAELDRLMGAVSRPVNVLAAGPLAALGVAGLAAHGVRRISLGGQLARLTHAAIRDGMAAITGEGSFAPFRAGMKGAEVDRLLMAGSDDPAGGG